MQHYWEDVPGLGNVVISRHAQERAKRDGISEDVVARVLREGRDVPDGDAVWRQLNGVRLVIVVPTPFRGAKLVTTMYRVKPNAKVR